MSCPFTCGLGLWIRIVFHSLPFLIEFGPFFFPKQFGELDISCMSSEFRLLVLSSPHFRAAFHLWMVQPFQSILWFSVHFTLGIAWAFQLAFRFTFYDFFRTFWEFMHLLTLFPLLYLSGPTRLSRQFDVACNQCALRTESFYSDLILDGCFSSENSPLGFVRSIWCVRTCVRFGPLYPFPDTNALQFPKTDIACNSGCRIF